MFGKYYMFLPFPSLKQKIILSIQNKLLNVFTTNMKCLSLGRKNCGQSRTFSNLS